MPVNITKFVWEKELKKVEKPKKTPIAEPVQETDDYILLTKDGTLKLKRSQYIEDMMGK
jgi:hypothetical protein